MRQILALPDRDKFIVFETLREYLGGELDAEGEGERQVRLRSEALEAMNQVALHLKLGEGKAPTATQFDKAAREIGLDWNSSKVVRAYTRWRNAAQAFRGDHVARTPKQRRLDRQVRGNPRTCEEYLAGVKKFLDTKPAKENVAEYSAWREDYNSQLADGEMPVACVSTLDSHLGIPWDSLKAAARGETSVVEASRKQFEATAGKQPLLSITNVARILERSPKSARDYVTEKPFPVPVAKINGSNVWRRKDVEAFHAGEHWPKRRHHGWQKRYIGAKEMRETLGFEQLYFNMLIRWKRWDRVPKPEGRIAQRQPYWKRAAFEKWLKKRKKGDS